MCVVLVTKPALVLLIVSLSPHAIHTVCIISDDADRPIQHLSTQYTPTHLPSQPTPQILLQGLASNLSKSKDQHQNLAWNTPDLASSCSPAGVMHAGGSPKRVLRHKWVFEVDILLPVTSAPKIGSLMACRRYHVHAREL